MPVAKRAGIKHSFTWLIGDRSIILKFALLLIVDLTSFIAPLTRNPGIFVCVLASSITNYFISANGLSRTIPAIEGSLSPCNSDVTAPIDLPHRPIVLTLLSFLRYSTIIFRSSLSNHPSDMYSPPESPHPAKSKQKRLIFDGSRYCMASMASNRLELFPCK